MCIAVRRWPQSVFSPGRARCKTACRLPSRTSEKNQTAKLYKTIAGRHSWVTKVPASRLAAFGAPSNPAPPPSVMREKYGGLWAIAVERFFGGSNVRGMLRSEEHTSEL